VHGFHCVNGNAPRRTRRAHGESRFPVRRASGHAPLNARADVEFVYNKKPLALLHSVSDLFRAYKTIAYEGGILGHDSCTGLRTASNMFANSSSINIMISVWWLLWAFVVGGYAGMLLIALMVVARKTGVRDSVFE
jgi:hypothetical protein